MGSKDHTGAN